MQTVIVVPAVLLAITMVFQAMEYYSARQAAETAARQAVDAARGYGSGDADGTNTANAVLAQLGSPVQGATVKVTTVNGTVVATITGHADQLVPGLVLDLSATAQGPVETYTGPP